MNFRVKRNWGWFGLRIKRWSFNIDLHLFYVGFWLTLNSPYMPENGVFKHRLTETRLYVGWLRRNILESPISLGCSFCHYPKKDWHGIGKRMTFSNHTWFSLLPHAWRR